MLKQLVNMRKWVGTACGLAVAGGLLAILVGAAAPAPSGGAGASAEPYRSPNDLAYSPDGKTLAVADRTAKSVVFIDAASNKVTKQAALDAQAGMVTWSADSTKVYISEYETGTVAEVSAADAKVLRHIAVGPYPQGVAVAAKKNVLLAATTGMDELVAVDLAAGKEKARLKMVREPFWIAITPDESMAVVSNLLPAGPASDPLITSCVTLVDLEKMTKIADIKLPPNTTCIRQVTVSPDGAWAYAVHTVGRTTLPATQLERGWVNTNALSVIDLKNKALYATVLMDTLSEGAADPWGVVLSKDGNTLWATLAGVHQIARIDAAGLLKNLESNTKPTTTPASVARSYSSMQIWAEIKKDPARRADLVNDLAALYVAGLIQRTNLPGKAPRGVAVSPDGKQLALGMYYTGEVLMVDGATGKVASTIALGSKREPDEVRRGEVVFHDAHQAFQHWLSCASCHPNDGRVDGMNWDLPNDGLGNPKSARSLLLAHKTPPAMTLGVREGMGEAAMAGFRFAARQPEEADLKAVQAYIRSLTPVKSPYRLANGDLNDKAKKGKTLFESDKVGCANCHSGEVFTNLKSYNVGTQGELDHKDQDTFDTPTLVEIWRTAPYLHDGSAATLEEVFTKHNKADKHGKTGQLSKEEIDALVEYLKSL